MPSPLPHPVLSVPRQTFVTAEAFKRRVKNCKSRRQPWLLWREPATVAVHLVPDQKKRQGVSETKPELGQTSYLFSC